MVALDVAEGDPVAAGQQLLVMESMKMEHVVAATEAGFVRLLGVAVGDTVFEGHPLVFVEPADVGDLVATVSEEVDLDAVRPDVALVNERHAITLDAARPDAVARRRTTGQRTTRENIDDLCDAGTFVEHGSLVLTPGTGLPMDEVIRKFPTDGMVCGVGSVNAEQFGADDSRTVDLRLRLHRARRHAGGDQPPEDRPHARAGQGVAAAARVLHRGRRRAGRHRRQPHR